MLIVIFSVMLYYYIKITIFENVVKELIIEADKIVFTNDFSNVDISAFKFENLNKSIEVEIQPNTDGLIRPKFVNNDDSSLLSLFYPYNDFMLVLKKDTTEYGNIVEQILVDILIINATAIFLIIFYALFLSRMLLLPIKIFSQKLSKMNERLLKEFNINEIPEEFKPLGESINRLLDRISTFVLYQKELFIGAAHELKTPLAVIKTKNEVTLIKQREPKKYIEALKNNNTAIDQMNKMISSILEIGRQENAQFEKPILIDIVEYLAEIGNNFFILAKGEKKDIKLSLRPNGIKIITRPTLFLHVIQNFVQNAIKFSPPNSTILIKSDLINNEFVVNIIDEGIGIDEKKDLFAPFKRYGDKGGAGLGLFLAKGAAQALGGNVEIKNRQDKKGTIATFSLPIDTNNSKFL